MYRKVSLGVEIEMGKRPWLLRPRHKYIYIYTTYLNIYNIVMTEMLRSLTLPETNIAPKNRWLEDDRFLLLLLLVSGGVLSATKSQVPRSLDTFRRGFDEHRRFNLLANPSIPDSWQGRGQWGGRDERCESCWLNWAGWFFFFVGWGLRNLWWDFWWILMSRQTTYRTYTDGPNICPLVIRNLHGFKEQSET